MAHRPNCTSQGKQPSFGSKTGGDTASTILGILEVSAEDFTKLLAETEAEEAEAQTTYEKLSDDNKVSKAWSAARAVSTLRFVPGWNEQEIMAGPEGQETIVGKFINGSWHWKDDRLKALDSAIDVDALRARLLSGEW